LKPLNFRCYEIRVVILVGSAHGNCDFGRTTKITYNDSGQNWDWNGSNYMLGTFTLDNVQYEKFTAGLAQKLKKSGEAQEKK